MSANPSPQPLTLDSLPYDILNLILDIVQKTDFETIRALRLVSKAMNEAADPKAFESMSIDFSKGFLRGSCDEAAAKLSGKTPRQLMDLVLSRDGQNLNARWTKRLVIPWDGLVPVVFSLCRSERSRQPSKEILECQARYLVPALRALKNVRCVNYTLRSCDPKENVLLALTELPRLEQLSIKFFDSGWISAVSKSASLQPFFDFTHLSFFDLNGEFPLHASMVSAIGHLINRSGATLETLSLHPTTCDWYSDRQDPQEVYLDEIFDNVGNQHRGKSTEPSEDLDLSGLEDWRTRLPKLSKLIVNGKIRLRDMVVPFLGSLVHLDIQNTIIPNLNAEPSFWQALTRAGIHLEYLSIYPVTPALVTYLTSYVGLRELQLRCKPGETRRFECMEFPFPLFTEVLPWQKKTLKHLSFLHLRWETWAIRPEYLEGILECENLETLGLIHYQPLPKDWKYRTGEVDTPSFMDLATLFSQVSDKLLKLQRLALLPAGDETFFRERGELEDFHLAIAEMLMFSLPEVKLRTASSPTPTFTLQLLIVLANFDMPEIFPHDYVFNKSARVFQPQQFQEVY